MVKDDLPTKSNEFCNKNVYIAKNPTQQPEFLKKYPNFDGRGVLIGIIDSCIDVSLPGLQKTSTGIPKIIDCFDLTGNGYVNTSTIKEADKNNSLIGLTGRSLKIPSEWKNPSGKWHLGIKSIYELFDEEALLKITELRRNKIKEENESLKDFVKEIKNPNDRNFMQKYLKETENLSKDSMVLDCIVWNNGIQWKACIDTSFIGDLQNVKVMTNFRDSHEFGILFDELVYCLNIRENGNLLEIYVTNTEHGTVIANICAGFNPDEPEKDGLAPGAQIISFAVVDPRNCGHGNDHAIVKAFHKCIEYGVDIINYSVGGLPEDEYELMKNMVETYGIIIVNAAGNEGPAHSRIYEIRQFQNVLFNIGSCLTSEMKKILYNIQDGDSLPAVSTFSSQGPFPKSGGRGITLVAPGHGIVKMPRHYPCKTQLFAATSYCAPNAVGAISCLISGLKAKSIPITFFKLKLALINTAFLPENRSKLSFGNGIIQIKNAFEFYLKNLHNFPIQITNITTSLIKKSMIWNKLCNNKNDYQSGILLKVTDRNKKIYNCNVKINIRSNLLIETSINIKWLLKLSPDSVTFIKEYSTVDENNEFSIKIDITNLSHNSINYGEILGFDSTNLIWGPLFYFPITVIIPKHFYETEKINEIIELNSTLPYRIFIPPFSSQISGFFIQLKNLESKDKSEVTVLIQCGIGDRRFADSEEIKFDENPNSQNCKFEIFNNNDIHEICIIIDGEKIISHKFLFELCFIGKPSLLSIIASFFKSPQEEEGETLDNLSDSNISLLSINEENEITYKLYPQKVKFKNFNGKKYFFTTYYFTVKKKTKCIFFVLYHSDKNLTPFKVQRIQVFTLSKKFVYGFVDVWLNSISLLPGTYIVKGLFEYFDDKLLQRILPLTFRFPVITLTVNSETVLKTFWSDTFDEIKEHLYSINARYGTQLPYSTDTKKYFNNANPKDAQLWTNNIQKYYSNTNYENVKKAADLFLQKVHAKEFLQNYKKIEKTVYFYEKEMIKIQKKIILDAIFYKTDAILNEYLNECKNIPTILTTTFDFNKFESKRKNSSLFDTLWSIFTYNIYPKETKKSKLPYANEKLEPKNQILELPQKSHKLINRKNIKNVTSLFIKFADDSDIRKTIIIIKKALIFGNFGTALLYLNKISTENQTNPNCKIFDEALIQLLKQFGWSHLAEAHENSLLDRHRNYLRMF